MLVGRLMFEKSLQPHQRILIFVWFLAAPLHADRLCQELLRALESPPPMRIPLLTESLLRGSSSLRGVGPGYFQPLFLRRYDHSAYTLHSVSPYKNDPSSAYRDDARVVLLLPRSSDRTVWAALNFLERSQLVAVLSAHFQRGRFAVNLSEITPAAPPPKLPLAKALSSVEALSRGTPLTTELTTAPLFGLSPQRLLQANHEHCKVGVCRTAACGLAGLLAELGVPHQDLRLVVGSREWASETLHVWVEYRVTSQHPWVEVDPTPSFGEAGFAPPTTNRESFPYVETIEDFLVPIQTTLSHQPTEGEFNRTPGVWQPPR